MKDTHPCPCQSEDNSTIRGSTGDGGGEGHTPAICPQDYLSDWHELPSAPSNQKRCEHADAQSLQASAEIIPHPNPRRRLVGGKRDVTRACDQNVQNRGNLKQSLPALFTADKPLEAP